MIAERGREFFAYARVSTLDQFKYGYGIDAQRTRMEEEVALRSWTLRAHFTDAASGRSLEDRPALIDALALLDAGEADGLIVAKLDRLSRSLKDFVSIVARASENGWSVVVLDPAVDTTTDGGRLMANVMAAFGDFERQLIRARTREALAAAQARGVHVGRPYSIDRATVEIIECLRDDGLTYKQIAAELDERLVPTSRGGKRWYPSVIGKVLGQERLRQESAATRAMRHLRAK